MAASEQLNQLTELLEQELEACQESKTEWECNKETFELCTTETFKYIKEQREKWLSLVEQKIREFIRKHLNKLLKLSEKEIPTETDSEEILQYLGYPKNAQTLTS